MLSKNILIFCYVTDRQTHRRTDNSGSPTPQGPTFSGIQYSNMISNLHKKTNKHKLALTILMPPRKKNAVVASTASAQFITIISITDILQHVVEFLLLKDLVSLDTSLVNKELRNRFLNSLSEGVISINHSHSYLSLRWILLRQVRLREITFVDVYDDEMENCLMDITESNYGLLESVVQIDARSLYRLNLLFWSSVFLCHFSNLTSLLFHAKNISLTHLKVLKPVFARLHFLRMYALTDSFDAKAIKLVAQSSLKLKELILTFEEPSALTDDGILELIKFRPDLEGLYLYTDASKTLLFSNVSAAALSNLSAISLKSIALDAFPNLTSELFESIFRKMQLVHLQLYDMDQLSDINFEHCTNLENITLDNLSVTDSTIKSISNLESLELLELEGCTHITDLGIEHLANGRCHNLSTLDLTRCTSVKGYPLKNFEVEIRTVKKLFCKE